MNSIAVVIPCFKVKYQILDVLEEIPKIVHQIYVIDDCCPQSTGLFVQANSNDKRIKIIFTKRIWALAELRFQDILLHLTTNMISL